MAPIPTDTVVTPCAGVPHAELAAVDVLLEVDEDDEGLLEDEVWLVVEEWLWLDEDEDDCDEDED